MSFRCFDGEETREFYEDFLGMEFTAAIPEKMEVDGRTTEVMHIYFRMADGDFIAFYDMPDDVTPEKFTFDPMELHLGMKVPSEEAMMTWAERLKERGIEYMGPMDHDMVQSIYFQDPNGLWLEATYQVPDHEEIMHREMSEAKDILADWTVQSAPKKKKFREIQ
ncbi:VOC family protein [Altericroceibacterium spongiae]|nr:VOC family protein [Altericroceibacterium spongiae]